MSVRDCCRIIFLLVPLVPGALTAQSPNVRDSAGIRIVESVVSSGVPVRFTLASKPDIVVGGVRDNPADELNPHASWPFALRLSGNRILVSDMTSWALFNSAGKLVSRLGREGAGPGEFRGSQNGCLFRGDSLLLWDANNRRISIWSPDGKLVREYSPPGFAYGASCLADGTIMVDGGRVASASATLPLSTFQIVSTSGAARGTTIPLPTTLYSGSVMREIRLVGDGDQFLHADGITLGVRVLDRSGKVIELMRTKDVPEPVTDANLKTRSMACRPDPATKVCTPMPTQAATWPAYYDFAVGDDGVRWFRLNGGSHDSVWVGYDRAGKAVGKLLVPIAGLRSMRRIVHFGKGEVLLSEYDDDGARRFSSYRIVAAGPR